MVQAMIKKEGPLGPRFQLTAPVKVHEVALLAFIRRVAVGPASVNVRRGAPARRAARWP